MTIWPTRPVEEQDTLTLCSWQVLELPDGKRHLIGYCIENREGRVSSTVIELDLKNLRATTNSGRIYLLSGGSGNNLDGNYVWSRWTQQRSIEMWSDVSDSVWQEHLALNDGKPNNNW